jgi:outer membrane protein, multidrug efflux system
MVRHLFLLLAPLPVVLGGCTMTPEHERPPAPVPAAWPAGEAYKGAAAAPGAPAANEIKWRDFFVDEKLRKVIESALKGNLDLRTAALNVERARALYGIQRASLLPSVSATGSYNRQRIPPASLGFGEALKVENYRVDLGIAAWEIDFFGRLRSLRDAALEEYFATAEARRETQILLVSNVAGAYLTLAADRENLKLARSTIETQQSAYDLIRRRFESGVSTELDVRQAQTRVESARVDESLYTRIVAQDLNALDLLVGSKVPEDLLPGDLGAVGPPKEFAPGMSSEVLLKRPDILEAEHRLKSSEANIGAARAAFFPRISLTSSIGTVSNKLSGLFAGGSEAWTFAPQIVMPIFDARTWSGLRETKVEREIAIARYQAAIQTAFREVADSLAVRGTVEGQMAAQQSLVEAVAAAYRLSNLRYERGVENFLTVLDAQRSLYAAQQGLIAISLARAVNQVRLYAVLGGGGDIPPEATPAAASADGARNGSKTSA